MAKAELRNVKRALFDNVVDKVDYVELDKVTKIDAATDATYANKITTALAANKTVTIYIEK